MAIIAEKPKRIHLLGDGRHEEANAVGVIKPGMLLKQAAGSTEAKRLVKAHDAADGIAEKAFALEDALQGRTINDNYANDELVGYVLCNSGDVVYALLSGGENADSSEFLASNGDGTLKVSTTNAIAVALEAVDASDSATTDERIRIRIL